MKLALEDFIKKLPLPATTKWPEGVWDIDAYRHGTMSVILYCPHGKDYQTAHEQDELYFVVKGSGILIVKDEKFSFGPGDALFVPAHTDHHFENCTADIAIWAVFWGPKGGER